MASGSALVTTSTHCLELMVTLLWKNLSKGLEQAFREPYLIIWLVLITMQRNVLFKISIKDLREFIQPLLCANY